MLMETPKTYYELNREKMLKYSNTYYRDNKEKCLVNSWHYQRENAEKIKAYVKSRTEKMQCECGCMISIKCMPKHKRSKKHEKLITIKQLKPPDK